MMFKTSEELANIIEKVIIDSFAHVYNRPFSEYFSNDFRLE